MRIFGEQQTRLQHIAADLKEMQKHLNEAIAAIGSLREGLEASRREQSQVKGALNAVVEALELEVPKSPSAQMAPASSEPTELYVVVAGDSLAKIAKRHGTQTSKLKEINGLKSDRIFVGQKLKIPKAR